MQALSTQRLKSGIERHWPRLQEGLLLLALMAVATLIAYEYDVFPNAAGVAPQEHVIEPREIIALAGLLCVCLLILAWRFLVSQRQETARRIEVENRVRHSVNDAMATTAPTVTSAVESLSTPKLRDFLSSTH